MVVDEKMMMTTTRKKKMKDDEDDELFFYLLLFLFGEVQHDPREFRFKAGVESSDVHPFVPEQRVEQRQGRLCCCCCVEQRGAAGRTSNVFIVAEALAVDLFVTVAVAITASDDLDALVAGGGGLERAAACRQRSQ